MKDSDFSAALQSLGSRLAANQIERQAYYGELVRLLHQRFRPSRVNVWRLEPHRRGEEKLLACVAEFSPDPDASLRRDTLTEAEFRLYLEVLSRGGVYISNDTLSDPALASMRASYLVPSNVLALMDAAIAINGMVVGVICCEQIGHTREWRQREVTALIRSSATVNVHLARLQAEDSRGGGLPS